MKGKKKSGRESDKKRKMERDGARKERRDGGEDGEDSRQSQSLASKGDV